MLPKLLTYDIPLDGSLTLAKVHQIKDAEAYLEHKSGRVSVSLEKFLEVKLGD